MKISPRLQYDIETALAEAYERGIEEGRERQKREDRANALKEKEGVDDAASRECDLYEKP
jgi:hypothetical protein